MVGPINEANVLQQVPTRESATQITETRFGQILAVALSSLGFARRIPARAVAFVSARTHISWARTQQRES